jgi:hypothetical protein
LLTIVTGWGESCYDAYAHRFIESFGRFWPADTRLLAYIETEKVEAAARAEQYNLFLCDDAPGFLKRHKNNPEHNGRSPVAGWREKDRVNGYSFRWDACKFAKQAYFPDHAAKIMCHTKYLAWFDADVVFTKPVNPAGIVALLPNDKHVAYLGRPGTHSEIGFQLYRLPEALPLLAEFKRLYDSDDVFKLREWHSAFVWDRAREISGVPCHNLTPNGAGNVWAMQPLLSSFSEHRKGKRKYRG